MGVAGQPSLTLAAPTSPPLMRYTPKILEALKAAEASANADIDRLTSLPKSHRYRGWAADLEEAGRRYERLNLERDAADRAVARRNRHTTED